LDDPRWDTSRKYFILHGNSKVKIYTNGKVANKPKNYIMEWSYGIMNYGGKLHALHSTRQH
jgi:hypothetical protein